MGSARGIGVAVAVAALFVTAPAASAAGLLSQTVAAATATDKSCTTGERAGTSVYTLTCETPQGVVKAARQVFAARGERLALDLRKDCRR